MNSWDCFDTLVARRFSDPYTVFDEVGKRLGIENFREIRILAEKKSDNTYDGIYKNLSGIDPSVEIEVEIEHCYPIIENIKKVEDNDLIVSDIYHTKETVEKILKKCGLSKNVKYYVTPDGKRKGWIWKDLPKIDLHIGDNKKSDIKSASNFGIPTYHYTGSYFNSIEGFVAKTNFELACWMKYVRLQCPYNDLHKKQLWEDQSNYNLPILALASLELPDKPIAFNFRDCIFWQPIYEKIKKKKSIRFDSSRAILNNPSNEYREYVNKTINDCVIVDLQGTGSSFLNFFSDNIPETYFLSGRIKENKNLKSITNMRAPGIEKHNCSNEGSIINWDQTGPVRLKLEHDSDIVGVQHAAFDVAFRSLDHYVIKQDINLLKYLLEKTEKNYTSINVVWKEKHE